MLIAESGRVHLHGVVTRDVVFIFLFYIVIVISQDMESKDKIMNTRWLCKQ